MTTRSELNPDEDLTVSQRVLGRFVAAVGEEPELKEVAGRLKNALNQSIPSEVALRQALFGDPTI